MLELTFGELKAALICCTVYKNCTGCPLHIEASNSSASAGDLTCTSTLMSAAMNCINVMEKDLDAAIKRAAEWEYVANLHEQALIELREDIDRRGKV